MKKCIKCNSESSKKWYSGPTCRSCWQKDYNSKYYQSNSGKIKEDARQYVNKNKEKALTARREYKRRTRDKQRGYQLKQYYGIDLLTYDSMVSTQENKCAICYRIPDDRLCVDHCHVTGQIRGLLCRMCNTALGGFKDSLDMVNSAANYLQKYSKP